MTLPPFEASLLVNTTGIEMRLLASLTKAITIVPGQLVVRGVDGPSGPVVEAFWSRILATDGASGSQIDQRFFSISGEVCVQLSEDLGESCLPMVIAPGTEDPMEVEVSGLFDGGDLRPLAPLGRLGVPDAIVDTIRILARPASPIALTIVADVGAVNSDRPLLSFYLSATAVIDLTWLGAPLLELGCQGTGELKTPGIGTDDSAGLYGAFLVDFPTDLLSFGDLELEKGRNFSVSLSSQSSTFMTVFGKTRRVSQGLGLYYEGRAPRVVQGLCPTTIFLNLSVPSLTSIVGTFSCPLDFVFLRASIASISYVRLSGIGISLAFAGYTSDSRLTATFGMFADFELATLNPLQRNAPDSCADSSNALCLRSTFTTEIGVKIGLTILISLTLSITSSGAWIEPLGMTDFALVDAAFSLAVGVRVLPTWPPTATPSLQEIFIRSAIHWKRSGTWPAAITTRSDGWPPDLSAHDVLEMRSTILYRPAGEQDDALLGIPQIGVHLSASRFYLSDVPRIFLDVLRGMRSSSNDSPLFPAPFGDFSLLAVVQQHFTMSFEFELEVSLVQEEGLTAGFFVSGQAYGYLLGAFANLGASVRWQPGGDVGFDATDSNVKEEIVDFLQDPLRILRAAGLGLNVNMSGIPWLPELYFFGYVSPVALELEAAVDFVLPNNSAYALRATFALEYSLSDLSFNVAFYTDYTFPILGTLALRGHVIVDAPRLNELDEVIQGSRSWSGVEVTGAINMRIFGFCMVGELFMSSTAVDFDLSLEMSLFEPPVDQPPVDGDDNAGYVYAAPRRVGYFAFAGDLSPSGLFVEGVYDGDSIAEYIFEGLIGTIGGVDDPGLIRTAVVKALEATGNLAEVFRIRSAFAKLDSSKFELELQVDLTVRGVDTEMEFGLPWSGYGNSVNSTDSRRLSPSRELPPFPSPRDRYEREPQQPWGRSAYEHHHAQRRLVEDCLSPDYVDEQPNLGSAVESAKRSLQGLSTADLILAMRSRLTLKVRAVAHRTPKYAHTGNEHTHTQVPSQVPSGNHHSTAPCDILSCCTAWPRIASLSLASPGLA